MRRLPILPVLLVVGALAFAFVSNDVLAPAEDDPRPKPQAASSPESASEVLVEDPDRCSEPPPDPIETGPCRLIVRATDEAVAPFTGQIDLWRLAAPGNDQWTAGDQRQARIAGDHGRYVFDDLPPGRYRIHAHEQRRDSKDPPAFAVAGDLTEAAFVLPGRRTHRVFLQVLDATGRRIEVARLKSGSAFDSYVHPGRPAWATQRARRDGDYGLGAGGGGSGGGCCGGRLKRGVEADDRGFDLGLHQEDGRYRKSRLTFRIEIDGHSTAKLRLTNDVQRERTYTSVVVPLQMVSDRVFLPNGERAIDAGARIQVSCEARLVIDTTPAEIWRTIPIQVRVSLDGYTALEDEFALDDGDWTMTLTPSPTD